MEAGQKFLIVLLTIAIVIASVLTVYTTVNSAPRHITGYDISDSGTGEVNLSIESNVEINFTTNSINFGSGRVDTGKTDATLDTSAGTVVQGNWTANSAGLVLENIGNINATINLKSGKTATTFIGGSSPTYQYKVTDSEGGCYVAGPTSYADVNTTGIGTAICSPLSFFDSGDSIRIDIKLVVPYDSLKGALSDTITATATAA